MENIERLIFEDDKVWRAIPDLRRFRDQWALSRISPHLRPTGRAAMMDFLSAAAEGHERALSEHFGRAVTIDRLDNGCVSNIEFDIHDPPELEGMSAYTGFGTFRKGGRIHITFWR